MGSLLTGLRLGISVVAVMKHCILRNVDWFTPNETEAEFYAGQTEFSDTVLEDLLAMGVHNIILKRGLRGTLSSRF